MTDRRLTKGVWLSSGSPVVTEVAAECGFDWLLLDLEHGCLIESEVRYSLMALKGSQSKGIVRVGSIDPVLIGRVLDWGAAGIMLPHVSSPEQAQECLRAMCYPPAGARGYTSSARAYGYGKNPPADPAKHPQPLFLAQIEDYQGVENAAGIARIPGVDVLFVGPSDLRLDLAHHPLKPDFDQAILKVAEAARAGGKQAGILSKSPDEQAALRAIGYTCVGLGSDLGVLRQGFAQMLR